MTLFLSPHLDDAVLSCGATIADSRRCTVVTVFSGAGDEPVLSPFAARYHDVWGFAPTAAEGLALRRREDVAACELLGAAYLHLNLPEAPYRYGPDGTPRCGTGGDLFSPMNGDDEALAAELCARLDTVFRALRPGVVYAPAAIGGHLDHRIARRAAIAAVAGTDPVCRPELMLYEDLPYAADPDDGRASAWLDAVAGVRLHRIAADTLRRKAAAVRAYASQLHLLAGADDPVERALVRHALRVGGGAPAERAWRWSRGAGGNPPAAVPGQHAANPPTARRKRSMDRTDVTASGWLAEARAGLLRDGVVVLRNTGLEGFARSVGEQMLAELDLMLPFESDFTVYAKGHLRQYPPVGPEAHVPELLGAEPVLALVNAVLNGPYVASYQGHTVLPGAHAQPVHADWEPLWPELDRPVPPFLLAVNIALQHTDEANGSVEIWPGTHLVPPRGLYQPGSLRIRPEHLDRRRAEVPPTYVDLEPGDVLVRDALTWHRGTTNASGSARPMLWLLLAQSWFRAEHDDELVLPAALRPAIERLPVGLACRYEAAPFDHLRLPDPADVRSGSRDRGASV